MKNKKKISIILIIISVLLICIGLFSSNKPQDNTNMKKNSISVDEASKLLYTTHILTEDNQYYSFIEEDDLYYYFEIINSSDEKQYLVNKKTKEIVLSYNLD